MFTAIHAGYSRWQISAIGRGNVVHYGWRNRLNITKYIIKSKIIILTLWKWELEFDVKSYLSFLLLPCIMELSILFLYCCDVCFLTFFVLSLAGGLMLAMQDLALCEEADQTTLQPAHDVPVTVDSDSHMGGYLLLSNCPVPWHLHNPWSNSYVMTTQDHKQTSWGEIFLQMWSTLLCLVSFLQTQISCFQPV